MSVKYFFGFQCDEENQITTELVLPECARYDDVAKHFFRFLSGAYGYTITAKDVIDEDSSHS